MTSAVILLLAAFLDYLIADPWGWPHPVRVIGWVISQLSKFCLKYCHTALNQRLTGALIAILVIVGTGLMGWLIIFAIQIVDPVLAIVFQGIMLASCFAAKSLKNAAMEVLAPLKMGNVTTAREILSNYVGRDTENLSHTEILRSLLETVTENATDGVTAPLFYAIIGAFIPVIGSVPLALAYKASSTLDSMIGYKESPYTYLGWFSARCEDYLTWLPCRFTVITLAILSGKPGYVWQICQRDAIKDPSPNSGWSECAYAAVLGVQMGGINWYRGIAKHKPLLGDAIYPITEKSIDQALQLTRYAFLLWLALATLGIIAYSRFSIITLFWS
ncbi:cobalamin biosynthesis protein [Anabaena sp. FACHB-1237]|uniref:adenosylcobinamide-phosphate synthase CbiB n=1 Tax=Anabaena sp. FACHB-1237 TaxID=2692769 RepID=UPI00168177BF|nr:adenosylcobinamide-phosphate synthase CbiB [Anabaena sp. FACHB-1237]MBD2136586.1 cobalamin biosynthesis protein [Anabaena sp. FACHB-1237]